MDLVPFSFFLLCKGLSAFLILTFHQRRQPVFFFAVSIDVSFSLLLIFSLNTNLLSLERAG